MGGSPLSTQAFADFKGMPHVDADLLGSIGIRVQALLCSFHERMFRLNEDLLGKVAGAPVGLVDQLFQKLRAKCVGQYRDDEQHGAGHYQRESCAQPQPHSLTLLRFGRLRKRTNVRRGALPKNPPGMTACKLSVLQAQLAQKEMLWVNVYPIFDSGIKPRFTVGRPRGGYLQRDGGA